MKIRHARFLTAFVFLCVASTWVAAGTVHHDLEVRIEPDQSSLQVVDRVNFVDAVAIDPEMDEDNLGTRHCFLLQTLLAKYFA